MPWRKVSPICAELKLDRNAGDLRSTPSTRQPEPASTHEALHDISSKSRAAFQSPNFTRKCLVDGQNGLILTPSVSRIRWNENPGGGNPVQNIRPSPGPDNPFMGGHKQRFKGLARKMFSLESELK